MPSRKPDGPKRRRRMPEIGTVEYLQRRERNNIAVQKSRQKTRLHAKGMTQRVEKLRSENEHLERQVEILSKELYILRDLFKEAHLGNQLDLPPSPTPEIQKQVDPAYDSVQEIVVSSDDDEMLPSEDSHVTFRDVDCSYVGAVSSQSALHGDGTEIVIYKDSKFVLAANEVVALDHKYSTNKFGIKLA